ncbi:MAG: oligosaccharide flippase family protein [Calditrichaeota bacterium]|nr:oligosaccharide flippase family protein [Calditrichota bacterium]
MFFTAGVSFATFSLLTRYLNEVDYGIINLYNSASILLVSFIGCGVQFVLNVDYFSLNKEQYKSRFSNGILIPFAISLLFTLGFVIFLNPLRGVLKTNLFFAIILPITCLFILFNDITLGLIRNKEKHFLFAGFSISKNLIEISFAILFVVYLGWDWRGRLAGSFITLTAVGFFAFFFYTKWHFLKGKIKLNEIKQVIHQGLPFIPERLAVFFIFYSDRFFIDHYEGTGDVGFYSAGAQIAVILNLISHSLNNTFYPYFYKRLNKSKIDYAGLRKGMLAFGGISAAMMIILIVVTPFIFKYFVGQTFRPGQRYAINLVIAFFFWALYNMLLPFLLSSRRNKLIMFISIIGMLLSVTLNFFFVKKFGALGATYTSLTVFATMFVITLISVHRIYNLKNFLLNNMNNLK